MMTGALGMKCCEGGQLTRRGVERQDEEVKKSRARDVRRKILLPLFHSEEQTDNKKDVRYCYDTVGSLLLSDGVYSHAVC